VPEVGLEPTSLAAEDFLTTSAFAAVLHEAGRSWSGARLHHSLSTVGARRLLSTPSLGPFDPRAWLGISSDLRPGPSPSLTGFTSRISPRGLKFGLSPLRLPIPPLGRDATLLQLPATTCLAPVCVALAPSWLLARKVYFPIRSQIFLETFA
jgi:hypothetical protein